MTAAEIQEVGRTVQAHFSPDDWRKAVIQVAADEGWCGYCGKAIKEGDLIAVTTERPGRGCTFCLRCTKEQT